MAKYIKLFEDYSKEKSEGWSTIRDAIQMRLPFAIIVFKKKSSYLDALDSGELDSDYIKQTAVLHTEGKPTDYPSIFMVVQDDEVFKNKIPNNNKATSIYTIFHNIKKIWHHYLCEIFPSLTTNIANIKLFITFICTKIFYLNFNIKI